MPVTQPVGPLRKVVETDGDPDNPRLRRAFGVGANPLVLLQRIAFVDPDTNGLDKAGQAALLTWAKENRLGQDAALLTRVGKRRTAALALLRARGAHVVRLVATPEWRLAVGIGNKANPHEIGLSLHGTHGWPVIPGTALKGLTLAQARGADAALLRAVFGWPLPGLDAAGGEASMGGVRFLDASPDGKPATVHVDVLTPHVKPYYDAAIKNEPVDRRQPPAEHHNPTPVKFLSISGRFAVDLVGDDTAAVEQATEWLIAAGDDLGAGGKTAAGYGYLSIARRAEVEAGG